MALLGRRAAALTPVNSHRLSDQTESPNVPGLNACPATPPAKARSKRRGRGGALEGAEGGERWAFAACLAVGSGLWCALLRLFLKRHRFPYHRHRTEAAALYGLPPLVFAGLRSFRPLFGRAIISRNGLEALFFLKRARGTLTLKRR